LIRSRHANAFTRPRPLWSLTLLLAFVLSTTGCGVKMAYNNVDRLIKWSMDDYMKLDPAQEAYFQSELDALLYWHRTTQLPVYAKAIREFDTEIANGATVEDLFVFNKEVEGWWDQVLEASMPLSTELMYSATDAQLDQFAVQYEKDIKKYIKPYEKLTPEARRARWARDFRDYFEYFTRLNNEQKQLIVAQSQRFVPDDQSWADYRRRYGAALIALVRQRQPYVQFSLAYRDMTFGRERWYGDEYAAALAANKDLYRDVTLALLDSLTAEQRRELSKSLKDVAKDLDELALDAPAVAPPTACLVAC
jgi:hypothetical protein